MDRIKFLLNSLAQQRNEAMDELLTTRADLLEARERIAELEAQIPKPDTAPEGAKDAGPEAQA